MCAGQFLVHSAYSEQEEGATLILWNVSEGRELRRIKRISAIVVCCAVSVDASSVAFGVNRGDVYMWRPRERRSERTRAMRLARYEGAASGLADEKSRVQLRFAIGDRFLMLVSSAGVVLWDARTLELCSAFAPDVQALDAIALFGGRLLLYANKDQTQVSTLLLSRVGQSGRPAESDESLNALCGPKAPRLFPSRALADLLQGKNKETDEYNREENLMLKLQKIKGITNA